MTKAADNAERNARMAAFCEALGVDPATIEQWVRDGKMAPELTHCLVTMEELFAELRPPLSPSEHQSNLLQKARKERRPASIRQYAEVHIRPITRTGRTVISFDVSNFEGTLGECHAFAKEHAAATGLPIIEHPGVNPKFSGREPSHLEFTSSRACMMK